MKKGFTTYLKVFISLAIIAVIFFTIDIGEVIALFSSINTRYLYIALALVPPSIFLRVVRWWYLINFSKETKVSLWVATKITLAGVALNMFMPAQSGEVLKGYFGYKWTGIKEKMFSISLYDKLIAIAGVGILGLYPALMFKNLWYLLGSFAALVPLGLLLGTVNLAWVKNLAEKASTKLLKGKINFSEALGHFPINGKLLIITIFLSAVSWIMTYGILWACLKMLASTMAQATEFLHVISVAPLLTLGRLFPFTLNGLGSDEALIVFLFKTFGVSGTLAFSAAIAYKLSSIVIPGLFGWIVILFTKNQKLIK